MIARTWAINKMVPQHPPHNVQKCQVAKMLVEGDMIQDLIDHKWTDEWGNAKWNTKLT